VTSNLVGARSGTANGNYAGGGVAICQAIVRTARNGHPLRRLTKRGVGPATETQLMQ
jgi:hypothetical protein